MLLHLLTFVHTFTCNTLFTPLYQVIDLFFKVCLGFHLLQETFLGVVVLNYARTFFDTSLLGLGKQIPHRPPSPECGLVVVTCF